MQPWQHSHNHARVLVPDADSTDTLCPMARFKPRFYRPRVWSTMSEEQRREALNASIYDHVDIQRDVAKRLSAACRAPQPQAFITARGRTTTAAQSQPTPRRLARSKRIDLSGSLAGWIKERRITSSGRKYDAFFSPSGQMFMSMVAGLRAVGASA